MRRYDERLELLQQQAATRAADDAEELQRARREASEARREAQEASTAASLSNALAAELRDVRASHAAELEAAAQKDRELREQLEATRQEAKQLRVRVERTEEVAGAAQVPRTAQLEHVPSAVAPVPHGGLQPEDGGLQPEVAAPALADSIGIHRPIVWREGGLAGDGWRETAEGGGTTDGGAALQGGLAPECVQPGLAACCCPGSQSSSTLSGGAAQDGAQGGARGAAQQQPARSPMDVVRVSMLETARHEVEGLQNVIRQLVRHVALAPALSTPTPVRRPSHTVGRSERLTTIRFPRVTDGSEHGADTREAGGAAERARAAREDGGAAGGGAGGAACI